VRGELRPIRAEYDAALRTVAEAGAVQARVEALKVETEGLVKTREELLEETAEARAATPCQQRHDQRTRNDPEPP
jgi:hypothetical protein